MPEFDDRLTELEIALAHHEATLEDLSALAHEQGHRIDRMGRLIERLALRVSQIEAGEPREPEPPPPHW